MSFVQRINTHCLPTTTSMATKDLSVCRVSIQLGEADGVGRSKRDAKHAAAGNLIKKLRLNHPDINEIPQAPLADIPTNDMYAALRDYCLQNDHPLPVIEIVQQSGTPDAPEFTAVCQVATIKRYGISEKKKDAKQIAAMEVLNVIMDDTKPAHQKQVALLENVGKDLECERRQKFKTYRELTDSKVENVQGVLLCNRHNYFTTYFENLKLDALRILNSAEYSSACERAQDLLKALKLNMLQSEMKATKGVEPLIVIELDCDYDCIFTNYRDQIYDDIIKYFKEMLV